MKLCEVLDFPVREGTFELLNLLDAVDEEVFHQLLVDHELDVTYNGVEVDHLNAYSGLLDKFYGMVRDEFKEEINNHWVLDFVKTVDAYYNWNNMCLYFCEEYKLAPQVSDPAEPPKHVEIYERVEYTNTSKKNHFKILTPDEYKKQTKDKSDLINLANVLR